MINIFNSPIRAEVGKMEKLTLPHICMPSACGGSAPRVDLLDTYPD